MQGSRDKEVNGDQGLFLVFPVLPLLCVFVLMETVVKEYAKRILPPPHFVLAGAKLSLQCFFMKKQEACLLVFACCQTFLIVEGTRKKLVLEQCVGKTSCCRECVIM